LKKKKNFVNRKNHIGKNILISVKLYILLYFKSENLIQNIDEERSKDIILFKLVLFPEIYRAEDGAIFQTLM
jgi:hypothetical protein